MVDRNVSHFHTLKQTHDCTSVYPTRNHTICLRCHAHLPEGESDSKDNDKSYFDITTVVLVAIIILLASFAVAYYCCFKVAPA